MPVTRTLIRLPYGRGYPIGRVRARRRGSGDRGPRVREGAGPPAPPPARRRPRAGRPDRRRADRRELRRRPRRDLLPAGLAQGEAVRGGRAGDARVLRGAWRGLVRAREGG